MDLNQENQINIVKQQLNTICNMYNLIIDTVFQSSKNPTAYLDLYHKLECFNENDVMEFKEFAINIKCNNLKNSYCNCLNIFNNFSLFIIQCIKDKEDKQKNTTNLLINLEESYNSIYSLADELN